MPVRSLHSPVLKWPTRARIDEAVREWARRQAERRPTLLRLGYFGSYARGDWGVGSDLDLVAIVTECGEAFEERPLSWDLSALPVPADLLVYTEAEWGQLQHQGGRFARCLMTETHWIYPSGLTPSPP